VGDLLEEYELRAASGSTFAAFRWILKQSCVSTLYLLWIQIRHLAWPSTIAVAFCAYFLVTIVEVVIKREITNALTPAMALTFLAVVLISYLASRLRAAAPIVLGVLMLVAVTILTSTVAANLPLSYRAGYFIVGPVAAFIGGAFRSVITKNKPQ
jgi:small-conductance mechanosensitive channel